MSCHVLSCLVLSCLVFCSHVMSCPAMQRPVMSCQVVSCQVMAWHGRSGDIMSCHVASCHVPSRHVLSCHATQGLLQRLLARPLVLDLMTLRVCIRVAGEKYVRHKEIKGAPRRASVAMTPSKAFSKPLKLTRVTTTGPRGFVLPSI